MTLKLLFIDSTCFYQNNKRLFLKNINNLRSYGNSLGILFYSGLRWPRWKSSRSTDIKKPKNFYWYSIISSSWTIIFKNIWFFLHTVTIFLKSWFFEFETF